MTRVSSRYFHTQAGYQATMLLAYDRLDHGRPLEAVVWLRRISESPAAAEVCDPDCSLLLAACWMMADNADRAGDVLRKLHERRPAVRFRIGNREFTASGDNAEALRWLAKMTDGMRSKPANAARTGRSSAATPPATLRPRGTAVSAKRFGACRPSRVRRIGRCSAAQKEALRDDAALLPAANPLVVGDTLLMRRPWQLVAIDAKSGKLAWQYPWEKPAVERKKPANRGLLMLPFGPVENVDPIAELRQRVFDDAAYGQLSSDGHRVFLLDKLDAAGLTDINRIAGGALLPLGRGADRPTQPNRLVALDLKREGTVAWAVGGQTGENEPKLAGMFFLGAPLPDPRQLYVLAECKGEIFLHALNAATGRVEWSRVIGCPGDAVAQEPLRRLVGASPSLADDVLVCPTNAGAVVAVDAATHSLLWGYEYPRSERFQQLRGPQQPVNPFQQTVKSESEVRDCWTDSCATIADGYVLLAPPDSDLLFCLDLFTGQEIWSARRGDNMFVAGIHNGKAILVGKREVTALRLADRKPAWPKPVALPDKSMPSGRGLACGDSYYLPTTAKQLVRINLDTGRIESSVETKEALGNLVGLPDRLISQTVEGVDMFGTEK